MVYLITWLLGYSATIHAISLADVLWEEEPNINHCCTFLPNSTRCQNRVTKQNVVDSKNNTVLPCFYKCVTDLGCFVCSYGSWMKTVCQADEPLHRQRRFTLSDLTEDRINFNFCKHKIPEYKLPEFISSHQVYTAHVVKGESTARVSWNIPSFKNGSDAPAILTLVTDLDDYHVFRLGSHKIIHKLTDWRGFSVFHTTHIEVREPVCIWSRSVIKNGHASCPSGDINVGTVCSVSCARGFAIRLKPVTTCLANFTFSSASKFCVAQQCRRLDQHFFCTDGNNINSVCSINCTGRGYVIGPTTQTTCTDTGTWASPMPSCKPLSGTMAPNYCKHSNCHHGVCQNLTRAYRCKCESGYAGQFCDDVIVDGKWSSWSSWGQYCSSTCSGGVKHRTRRCDNPEPSSADGKDCVGSTVDEKPCNTNIKCPKREEKRTCRAADLKGGMGSVVKCVEVENGLDCTAVCQNPNEIVDVFDRATVKCRDGLWDTARMSVAWCMEIFSPTDVHLSLEAKFPLNPLCSQSALHSLQRSIENKTQTLPCHSVSSCSVAVYVSGCPSNENTFTVLTINMTVELRGRKILLDDYDDVNGANTTLKALVEAKEVLENSANKIEDDDMFYKDAYLKTGFSLSNNAITKNCHVTCPPGMVEINMFCVFKRQTDQCTSDADCDHHQCCKDGVCHHDHCLLEKSTSLRSSPGVELSGKNLLSVIVSAVFAGLSLVSLCSFVIPALIKICHRSVSGYIFLLSGPSRALGYFPFQPVLHNWFNKGRGVTDIEKFLHQ